MPGTTEQDQGRQLARPRASPTSSQDLVATDPPSVATETGQEKCRLHIHVVLSQQALSREAFYITACPLAAGQAAF